MTELITQLIASLLALQALLTPVLEVRTLGAETPTVREQLEGKTQAEKVEIKSTEIAKLNHVATSTIKGITVEIQKLKKIDGGVEVYARAWKGDEQLGFGDGSVEIERFRIFNPPVLVPDPNGSVVREYHDGEIQKFREDPIEAIKQSLVHTVLLTGKVDTSIEKGKVGNTTSTFYPAAAENEPVDGNMQRVQDDSTFVQLSTGTGTGSLEGQDSADCPKIGTSNVHAGKFETLHRCVYGFATASIPDTDAISAATFSVVTGGKTIANGDTDVDVIAFNPAADNTLANSDFENGFTKGTPFASKTVNTHSTDSATYNDYPLDAAGIAHVDKAGNTFYGLLLDWDNNDEFTGIHGGADKSTQLSMRFADQAGSSIDPKLTIIHAAAAAGGGSAPLQDMIIFD